MGQRASRSFTVGYSRDFVDPADFSCAQRGKHINLYFCLMAFGIRDGHDMPVSQQCVMTPYLFHAEGDIADLRTHVLRAE